MSNLKLTAADTLGLAAHFRRTSAAVGDFLYNDKNWVRLKKTERAALQTLEVTLLNVATDLTTQGMGRVIGDSRQSVAELQDVTEQARKALEKIEDVKQAINLVSSLIELVAAISTGSGTTVFAAFKEVKKSVEAMAGDGAIKPATAAPLSPPSRKWQAPARQGWPRRVTQPFLNQI